MQKGFEILLKLKILVTIIIYFCKVIHTSLLCNVFRYFAEMYLKIYDIYPCHFYSAPELLWTTPLKKDQNWVRTIKPYQIVRKIQKKKKKKKRVRDGICHAVFWQAKANNNYMEDFDKCKDPSYIMSLFKSNLHVKSTSEKLSMVGFQWNEVSKFTEKSCLKLQKR